MGEIGELAGRWPAGGDHDLRADEKALEAVFASLGRGCVRHLVTVPHPFGLPPRDRLVAQRWLSREAWARQWKRDVTIVLLLVAVGLSATALFLSFSTAAQPRSDGVRIASQR